MSQDEILLRYVYLPLAAIGGAISSLGARRWRQMGKGQMAFAVFTGVSFALFVTPFVAHSWFGISETDARAIVALTYVFGFGAHLLLPWVIRRVVKLIGSEHLE